jgi:hypothetical protein
MKFWILAAITFFSLLGSAADKSHYIVLVPGSLSRLVNTLYPKTGYYGRESIEAAKQHSAGIYVVRNLDSFGGFKKNGDLLARELTAWYSRQPEKLPIIMVGHSSGAFYSIYVASKNILPIKSVVGIATPFSGSDLADTALSIGLVRSGVKRICKMLSKTSLDCTGVLDLTSRNVNDFLRNYFLAPDQHLFLVGGSQTKPPSLRHTFDAEYLSSWHSMVSHFLKDECSDGIVTCASAYSTPLGGHDPNWQRVNIHPLPELHVSLEHGEQVLDDRIYRDLFGVRHPDYIRKTQREFFEALFTEVTRY